MFRVGGLAAVAAGLALLAAAPSGAAAQDVSFRGKTITMLIGSEPGGGTDASGRLIAQHLRQYLPGEPNIVVQNIPGASGMTALNYFVHRTAPDGLTVAVGSISTIDPIIFGISNAQYDPRTFRYIGGFGRGGSVVFANKAAAARLTDKSAKPVIVGSILTVPRPAIQPALWGTAFLGWHTTWITGYRSTPEVMLALDRGEIDMTSTASLFQIKDRLKSGQLKVVLQTGTIEGGKVVGRPDFGDAPLFPKMMEGKLTDPAARKAFDLWTAMNGGDKWLALAPGTADDTVAAYRDAFTKLAADKPFIDEGERISEGFAAMPARDVEYVVKTLADTPPEAVEYTKALMRQQGVRIK
jgi:tripartite-type tricarboxylate transporter receptor subunit TctC